MMEQNQTHENLLRINRALRLLVSCNKVIFHADDEQRLLSDICRQIVKVGGYRMAWVGYAQHDEGRRILPVAAYGYEDGYLESLELTWADTERGRGPGGQAVRSGQTQVNQNFRTNPSLAPWRESALMRGYQSNIAIPLLNDEDVLGILNVYAEQPDAFTREEVSLLEELAHDLTFGLVALRTRAETGQLRNEIQHAEAALQNSQAQYLQFVELTNEGIWSLDAQRRTNFVNPALCHMLGYRPAEMLGHPMDDFLFEDYGSDPRAAPAQRQSGYPAQYERRFRCRDGSACWCLVNSTSLYDLQGVYQGTFAMLVNITDRKQTEEALLEREYLLSESQRIAHIGSWSWDLVHNQITWSDEAYRLFGKRKETFDLALESFIYLIHPEDRTVMENWIRACLQGGRPPALSFRVIHADGTIRVLNGQGGMQFDELGKPIRMIGTVQDITDRDRIEKALQESEQRYRNFAERLPLGVVITHDGRIKYVNQTLVDAIGYSREELLEQPFLPFVFEQDQAWLLELHQRRMHGESVTPYYTFRIRRRDGEIRQWENHASTTEWMGKLSSLGIVTDITERAAMEEVLRHSLHQLEEKEKSKSRFLAAAGHDMRQPLAAANLFIDALKFTELTPEQERIVQRLEQSMRTFNGLLDSLLNISKLDAGIITPKRLSINVIDLFNWLEQSFAPLAAEKQLAFRLHFPVDQPLAIHSDLGLLRSILMNLVSNAIKFTQHGGILVSARRRGNGLLLQVWDTGMGIAAEHIDHIFDEFYQVNNPQRDIAGGLGLGLSIARRAMTLLDGRISCRSRPGHGTVFSFQVPLDQLSAATAAPLPADTVRNETDLASFVANRHFIVVEDNAMVADAMSSWLARMGATVTWFNSADAALQQPGSECADCYIIDYMLGSTHNGIQLLRQLRDKRNAPLCATLVTGDTSPAFIQEAKHCEWPVLHKPVDMRALLSSLMQQQN